MENKIERLRKFFENKGIKQEQIAEKLGVDKAYVNKLLVGKKQFGKNTARKWSDLFGLSYTWLLTGDGQMLSSDNSQGEEETIPYFLYKELLSKYEDLLRENEQLRHKITIYENGH